jgi:tRNA(adenine34) deaminase
MLRVKDMAEVRDDEYWMGRALKLAQRAGSLGEVPVGAILVRDGKIIAQAYNRREGWTSPLAHAELIALQRASQRLQSWRLENTTLYVTLEPCTMCAGALVQSRVRRLVYGALDPRAGAVKSLYQVTEDLRLNHRLEVTGGIHAHRCGQILTDFFKKLRSTKK